MAKKKSLLKKLIYLFIICAVAFVAFHFVYPDVSKLKKENPKKSAFMEYREDEWAREGKKYKIQQVWVPLWRHIAFSDQGSADRRGRQVLAA